MIVVRHVTKLSGKKYPEPYYRCGTFSIPARHTCTQLPLISVKKIDTIAWQFIQDTLNELNSLKDILQSTSSSVISGLESIDELIIYTEREQERTIADIRRLSGRARELMIVELNRLERDLQKLRAEKDKTLPHAKQAERAKVEVEEFFRWCEEFKGKYEEATYEEKRRALRMLGIRVSVYRPADPDHEQYTITARPEIIDRLTITRGTEKTIQHGSDYCETPSSHVSISDH